MQETTTEVQSVATAVQPAIFSTVVQGSGKTYFFDVRQAKSGKQSKYIQITETRLHEGQRIRHSVTVFPDHLDAFLDALAAAKENMV